MEFKVIAIIVIITTIMIIITMMGVMINKRNDNFQIKIEQTVHTWGSRVVCTLNSTE